MLQKQHQQERLLGQWKTSNTRKFPHMTYKLHLIVTLHPYGSPDPPTVKIYFGTHFSF